ncbi:MAG: hypothetical protein ACE5GY_02985 [Thermodesulfobacteriota bacterium]
MIKKIIPLFLLVALLVGCSHAVRQTVTPEYYRLRPATVALLPVSWESDAAGAKDPGVDRVFNEMVAEKVRSLGYEVTVVEEGDEKLSGQAAGDPASLATAFGADAIMYPRITSWDTDTFVTYAAISLAARFTLYSANGAMLWEAEYDTRASDFTFDRTTRELAVIEAYEPKLQRFIDIVFDTLPRNEAPKGPQKRFFDWLP